LAVHAMKVRLAVHAMKVCGRADVHFNRLLTSVIDAGDWIASFPAASSPGNESLVPTEITAEFQFFSEGFGVQNILGCRTFWSTEHFGEQNILGYRTFWGAEHFGVQNILGNRTFWGTEHFGVQNIL